MDSGKNTAAPPPLNFLGRPLRFLLLRHFLFPIKLTLSWLNREKKVGTSWQKAPFLILAQAGSVWLAKDQRKFLEDVLSIRFLQVMWFSQSIPGNSGTAAIPRRNFHLHSDFSDEKKPLLTFTIPTSREDVTELVATSCTYGRDCPPAWLPPMFGLNEGPSSSPIQPNLIREAFKANFCPKLGIWPNRLDSPLPVRWDSQKGKKCLFCILGYSKHIIFSWKSHIFWVIGDFYVIFYVIFGEFLVGTGEPPPYCDNIPTFMGISKAN